MMKEGFIVGLMVGGLVGVALHKYCKNVQKLADKGEKMVLDEMDMIQKEAEKAQNKIKTSIKKNNQTSK